MSRTNDVTPAIQTGCIGTELKKEGGFGGGLGGGCGRGGGWCGVAACGGRGGMKI